MSWLRPAKARRPGAEREDSPRATVWTPSFWKASNRYVFRRCDWLLPYVYRQVLSQAQARESLSLQPRGCSAPWWKRAARWSPPGSASLPEQSRSGTPEFTGLF